MGNYRGHRERRGRRNENEADFPSGTPSEPSYFQRPAPAVTQPVDAEVVWFSESKGFGFVRLQDGTEAYLHVRALEAAGRSSVGEGTRLKAVVEENQRGRQVTQVLEIGEAVTKRPSQTSLAREAPWSPDPAGEVRGTVKWYNAEKGFGFIAPRDGEKDVFVHASVLSRHGITTLAEGQQVLMECGQGKKGLEVRSLRLG